MATAALQFFVVTDFCFPALRQDNSLYSHTLNWGEWNEKKHKGQERKTEKREREENHLQLLLYWFRSSATAQLQMINYAMKHYLYV